MALFDLAWARKTGGQFVLRIEDTDRARLVEGSEQQIFETLKWLGLGYDEGPDVGGDHGPYRQSERLETYQPYVDRLLAEGHAYYCWCSGERLAQMRAEQQASKQSVTGYDRLCWGKTREERAELPGFSEKPVVRMLVPDDVPLVFDDIIRGQVKAPRPDDQVILKTDGFPTYHLAVVVDDHLMGITTVVRGEEWISSTPKHVLLYDWLGFERPEFAHMPLLRNTDKSKISKRKNPAARLMWFREQGYLPQALRNFLQLLAYPPVIEADGTEREVVSFEEFVAGFDWTKINTVGPIFDLKKLDWLNGVYLRELDVDELTDQVIAFEAGRGRDLEDHDQELLRRATPLLRERMTLLGDALPALEFLFTADADITHDETAVAKLGDNVVQVLDAAIPALEGLGEWAAEPIQAVLREVLVDGLGIKPKFAFGPVRVGITGKQVSPPLFESMELLGRDSSLARLRGFRSTL